MITISKDGVLVVKRSEPFASEKEQTVVPRSVLGGLLIAMHVKLDHTTRHQLDLVVRRHFFALNMNKAIERATSSCQTCASLEKFPKSLVPHTSRQQRSRKPPKYLNDCVRQGRIWA